MQGVREQLAVDAKFNQVMSSWPQTRFAADKR